MLQLLEHNKSKTYCVWFRWGRVGKAGQSSNDKCGSDLEKAKNIKIWEY
jgi:predicted DNA-binding WGR domain protein